MYCTWREINHNIIIIAQYLLSTFYTHPVLKKENTFSVSVQAAWYSVIGIQNLPVS